MPSYNYKCNICGHTYGEVREIDHPQWFTVCPVIGCTGTLEEI
jgi:predicted nucleic acid-binding Zn ribbon protein